ncbi:MAG: hypothetical protein IPO17_14255 [Flavobacteriales bacterium]|nr:hypothetical protein [Flavobacteriales bacterium]
MERFRNTLSAVLVGLLCNTALAQYPMTVMTNAPMPPPFTYAELLDLSGQVTVTISNTGPARDARARASLRNEAAGISITTNDAATIGFCENIPNGTTTFQLEELANMLTNGGAFDASLFDLVGIDIATIEQEQLLPGPAWQLCVQLLDCTTDEELSAPIPAGCVSFSIPELNAPILTDICDLTYTLPEGVLMVSWVYSAPPAFDGDINFQLQIVRIEPEDGRDGDANDAILSATEPFLYNVVHDESPAIVEIPDDLLLQAGYRYAVRVTAGTGEGLFFQPLSNNPHSEVCSFTYNPEGLETTGLLQPRWPANGAWVPFNFVNVIAFFEPLRPYTHFSYLSTMRSLESGDLPDYSRDLNWPDGPPSSQSDVTFGVDPWHSQHLSVYHPNGSIPDNSFKRGDHYRWRTVGDFTMGSNTYHGDSGEEPFQIGMGESRPEQPENGAIVPAGDVVLRWRTADVPNPMLPPYAVVQATAAGGTTFINGWVDELWELQVSRQSDFSTIWQSTTGTIEGAGLDLLSAVDDPAAFEAAVFKQLEHTVNATEEGTYYWRLNWKKDPDNANSANYNTSVTYTFCVGECSDAPVVPEEVAGPCVSVCLEPEPTSTTAVTSLAVGSTVRVGKFNMEVITVSGTGTTFSGTGKIEVHFLNNAKIMVAFNSLQVNSEGRMLDGEVEGRKDWNPASLTMVTDGIRRIPSMSEADVEAMNGFIQDGVRLVSLLGSGSEVGLPIGIDREVDGRLVVCGIINMKFDVTRAYMDMVAGIELPEIHTKLAFGVGDLCFTPDGLGDEGRAYLPYDITVTGDLTTSFRFRGGASTELDNLTYVDWDCEGFKCMQVACAVDFDRGTLLPEGDHDPAGTEEVTASFKFQICRELTGPAAHRSESWNVLAQFTMDPFEVPGAPGWVFTIEEAWLDWSTVSNPTGISFPEGYDNPALNSEGTADTWKGFFLKRLAMTTPEVLGDGTGEPFGGSVNNFIIDDGGLTFNFALTNILAINQGRIDSWAFSIDSVYMDMMENTFQRAGLGGQIGLPINGAHEFLNYGAILGFDDDTDEFAFILEVELDETLTAPLWIAELELEENSYVRATISSNSKVRAELNGSISISTALSSQLGIDIGSLPSINMPGMDFEDLVLDSEDGISCGNCAFAYASPQKDMGGFPLSIRNLSLEFDDPQHPALVVEPMISLSGGEGESSFAASVALKFVTVLQVGTGGVERFDFQDVQITGIHLDVDVSAMRLVGDVRITKTAVKEEVKGALAVSFPMGIRGELQAIFGTVKQDQTVPINSSAQHYNYWMVDGMIYFNPGLMIFSGVGIYGFGGGAYHHMRFIDGSLPSNGTIATVPPQIPPDELPPTDPTAGDEPPNDFQSGLTADASTVGSSSAPSGGTYEEDFNTLLGIRLALVFGTYPNPKGCNMDLILRAEFASTGGLALLAVDGNIYALVDIPERADARITGHIGFSYANHEGNEVIHANLSVMLNFEVIVGAGDGNKLVDANFHSESATDRWYFIMGRPENPGGIIVGPRASPILTIENYIMVGNDGIPAQMPDPPAEIMAVLGLNDGSRGLGTEEETRSALGGTREVDALATGAGFAFGMKFDLNLDLSLALLYVDFRMILGLDMLLREYDASMMCEETRAIPVITVGSRRDNCMPASGANSGCSSICSSYGSEHPFSVPVRPCCYRATSRTRAASAGARLSTSACSTVPSPEMHTWM